MSIKKFRKRGIKMYYRADVYINDLRGTSFIADSIEVLKSKAQPYIEDGRVTQIVVSKVEDIGFFKTSKEFEKYWIKEML